MRFDFKKSLHTLAGIRSVGQIIPALMSVVTQAPRYLPEIEWSRESWTHNIFRAYELLFWRRYGIRPELTSSAYQEDGVTTVTYAFHTLEAVCAHVEGLIRKQFEWKPFRIYIPRLVTPQGFSIPASPFLFAIALDATSIGVATATSVTVAHTCTGSNRVLVTGSANEDGNAGVTGCTYNSVAMTDDRTSPLSTIDVWHLIAPATGANNVVFSVTTSGNAIGVVNVSYTGCKQSGQPDAVGRDTGNGTAGNIATTTVADNSWIFICLWWSTGTTATGTATTQRGKQNISLQRQWAGDSNGAITPAGASTLQGTNSSSTTWDGCTLSIAPPSVAPTNGASFLVLMV